MRNFLIMSLSILQLAAVLLFFYFLFILVLALGSSHNVPDKTYMVLGMRCIGAIVVVLVCRFVLYRMKKK
jgi:hypothetical protein